jgi:hypothetical protein
MDTVNLLEMVKRERQEKVNTKTRERNDNIALME